MPGSARLGSRTSWHGWAATSLSSCLRIAFRPGAEEIGQRMLVAVPFNQTCSVGIAAWDRGEAGYELVHRADQAMHAAKAAGGGNLAIAPIIEPLAAAGRSPGP